MLVKKKNPEWFPSENKGLKVGDTIEITDPKALILGGDAVAVDATGNEVSAFELYGVIVKDEMEEFQEYMKLKKAEVEKARLEKEKTELEAAIAAEKAAKNPEVPVAEVKTEAPVAPTPVAVEPVKKEEKKK